MTTAIRYPFQTLSNASERAVLLKGGNVSDGDETPFLKSLRAGKLPQGVKMVKSKAKTKPTTKTKNTSKADRKKTGFGGKVSFSKGLRVSLAQSKTKVGAARHSRKKRG